MRPGISSRRTIIYDVVLVRCGKWTTNKPQNRFRYLISRWHIWTKHVRLEKCIISFYLRDFYIACTLCSNPTEHSFQYCFFVCFVGNRIGKHQMKPSDTVNDLCANVLTELWSTSSLLPSLSCPLSSKPLANCSKSRLGNLTGFCRRNLVLWARLGLLCQCSWCWLFIECSFRVFEWPSAAVCRPFLEVRFRLQLK